MRFDTEVVVVGGGIAGATAAKLLGEAGHDVIVLERERHPRAKVCGEGLLPHGVAALTGAGFTLPAGARPFGGIRWTHAGVTASGRLPALGYGLRRDELDAAVWATAARQPSVDARAGTGARGIARDPDGTWVVRLDDGAGIRCRAVVGADGLHSRVRRWAGLEGAIAPRRRYGLRRHYAIAGPDEPWVDVHVVDGGEVYVTPVAPGVINVAALCERETLHRSSPARSGRAEALFEPLVRAALGDRLDGATPLDEVATCGPLRRDASGVVADGLLLIGDAAGFVDGITGEGMSVALRTARLAAEVLAGALAAGRPDAAALRAYGVARGALVRDTDRLTRLVLWGMGHRWLAARVVRGLAGRPDLFDRLLAVENGDAPLSSIGLGGALRLVLA